MLKTISKFISKYGLLILMAIGGLITGIKEQKNNDKMEELNANILDLSEKLNKN